MADTQIATGGQGPLNQYINWCNFTGIVVSIGTTLTLLNTIPNVGKVTIDLYSNSTNTNNWLGFTPGGAPFNIAYTGVTNSPGIYTGSAVQTLNFNNIRLTDFSNNPLNKNYSVFVCDAEITGSTAEFVRWTTDSSPWILLATIPNLTVNDISSGAVSTVVFKVKVESILPNPIINSAYISGTQGIFDSATITNSTATTINFAWLNASKVVDKTICEPGEELTYSIYLNNNGNVTATNVVFLDTLPNGTVLVADSVSVNGATQTGANPNTGVTIPNIAPGATSTITFSVQVQCS